MSRSNPVRRPRRGASLIEAMLALGLIAFGMSGFTTAMIASAQQDRRNSARAAAKAVADELAAEISTWRWTDPRLAVVNGYTDAQFSDVRAQGGTVVQGSGPSASVATPSTVTGETLVPAPDHTDAQLTTLAPAGAPFRGRTLTELNSRDPGLTYVFNRYWNVSVDPSNPSLKVVAVHVTYGRANGQRDVVTTYTTVANKASLANAAFNQN